MSIVIQGTQLRTLLMGSRVSKASAVLPATTSQTLFTVSGGRVLVTSLTGIVTVVFDGTTNSLSVTHTPTSLAEGDLAAATVCTSDIVGTLYTVSGIQAALLGTQKEGGTEVPTHVVSKPVGAGFIIPAGIIKLKTTGTDTTGSTAWALTYVPLDDGASVA